MSNIAVVYWSGTGNTKIMAEEVAKGARDAGAKVSIFTPCDFSSSYIDKFDAVAFGCPAMGTEVLEEQEVEPMFSRCIPKLKGKKIALFGSCGWGHGEWMFDWQQRCRESGAVLPRDGVIASDTPDESAKKACHSLGKSLV